MTWPLPIPSVECPKCNERRWLQQPGTTVVVELDGVALTTYWKCQHCGCDWQARSIASALDVDQDERAGGAPLGRNPPDPPTERE